MNITRGINQYSGFCIASIFLFSLWAFWPGYFNNPLSIGNYRIHTHGVFASLWVLLLFTQAILIRFNRRALHRILGKSSFVLAPIVWVTTLMMAHDNLLRNENVDGYVYYFTEAQLFGLVFFAFYLRTGD